MADFPYHTPGEVTYTGPTLFIRGTKSKYVGNETIPAIKKFFPNSTIVDVKAGHWLISENPEAFRQGMCLLSSIIRLGLYINFFLGIDLADMCILLAVVGLLGQLKEVSIS